MNYLRPTIFGLVMLLYLWYPFSMIQGQEEILKEGVSYRFKPRPVDPVDAFRGRYIILGYDNFHINNAETSHGFSYGQTVYASLNRDTDGYAYFTSINASPPRTGDYLITTCASIDSDKIILAVPDNMKKYFLNETIAPEAERLYRQFNRNRNNSVKQDSNLVYIDTRILNGAVLLEKIYFNNQTVEDFIRSQSKH